jgi:hypothetical protein
VLFDVTNPTEVGIPSGPALALRQRRAKATRDATRASGQTPVAPSRDPFGGVRRGTTGGMPAAPSTVGCDSGRAPRMASRGAKRREPRRVSQALRTAFVRPRQSGPERKPRDLEGERSPWEERALHTGNGGVALRTRQRSKALKSAGPRVGDLGRRLEQGAEAVHQQW